MKRRISWPKAVKLVASSRIALATIYLAISLVTQSAVAAQTSPSPLKTSDMAKVDEIVSTLVKERGIPGAALVIVQGDEMLLVKGYGYADKEKGIPVDPEKTVFRVGSVSKSFTATGALHAVDAGLLDLHGDVNRYLSAFQISPDYPQPVTLHHLLTHTAGFELQAIGTWSRDAAGVVPMGQYLAARLPARVQPPGELYMYTDQTYTLIGYLIEAAAGVPFAQYMEENIFRPLEMYHTSFRQPLPPELASSLAVGYQFGPVPFEFFNDVPAAVMSTTAVDMGHFIIAQLQNGRYQDTRILQDETARLMHSQQFAYAPEMPGMAYGFQDDTFNGQHVVRHGGSVRGFSSDLLLFPELGIGISVLSNSPQAGLLASAAADYIIPEADTADDGEQWASGAVAVSSTTGNSKQALAGYYRSVGYARTTLEKMNLFGLVQEIQMTADAETLFINGHEVVEVAPLLFRYRDDGGYVLFREAENGRGYYAFIGLTAFEKLKWYETSAFIRGVFVFCFVTFVTDVLLRYGRYVRRRWRKQPAASLPRLSKAAQWVAGLTGLLNAVFIFGLMGTSASLQLYYGLPTTFLVLLVLPILAALLTPGLLFFTVVVWQKGYGSVIARIHYTLMAAAAVSFIWFLNYLNLFGYHL